MYISDTESNTNWIIEAIIKPIPEINEKTNPTRWIINKEIMYNIETAAIITNRKGYTVLIDSMQKTASIILGYIVLIDSMQKTEKRIQRIEKTIIAANDSDNP